MYSTSGIVLLSSILTTGYALFVSSAVDSNLKYNDGNCDWCTTSSPYPDPANWWEENVFIVLALLAVVVIVGIAICIVRALGIICNHTNENGLGTIRGCRGRGPFSPQELPNSSRSSAEFHNNVMASWQDAFTQPEPGGQPSSVGTQRRPTNINRDMTDKPPSYAALQEAPSVLPKKIPEGASIDSDFSIIESPPSYFMARNTLPTYQMPASIFSEN